MTLSPPITSANASLARSLDSCGLAGLGVLAAFPISAPLSRPSAASRLPRPSSAKAGRSFQIPKERLKAIFAQPKTPHLDRLLAEAGREIQEREKLTAEFRQLREAIEKKVADEEWSERRFAKETGLAWRTWQRLLDGKADLAIWLPKIRTSAQRLQIECNPQAT